ncbi:MAG: hypothetical protein RLZZ505_538 [Verrucomicrobiota bacterium]|jgi:addiction module HigA family antidote
MKTPITPGEILLEEYLQPMGISQNAMARAIGVPLRAINEIVPGKRSITPAMSIRFDTFFGQSDTFWHGIQVECDFRALARKLSPADAQGCGRTRSRRRRLLRMNPEHLRDQSGQIRQRLSRSDGC